MKKFSILLLVVIFSFSSCKNKYEGVPFTEKEPRDWENPTMFNQNREDAHASIISYPYEDMALDGIIENSPNYLSLDGV